MSKRYRFIILILVLGVCFLFLWPTIRWYYFVPLESKSLALESRERIRNYSEEAAITDIELLLEAARNFEPVPEEFEYLIPISRRLYRDNNMPLPETWTARTLLEGFRFASRDELREIIETNYRDEIFELKDLHRNAVKLGLDLSGGLSIVLQANLESYAQRLGRPIYDEDRVNAMNGALEILNNRIDRFGLTEPVIRRQGMDRIYIEIPGTADPERINDIIMGKGSLAFHLEDSEATQRFNEYYRVTLDATGWETNPELIGIPPDVMILGYYIKDRYGLDVQARDFDNYRRFIAVKREPGLDGTYIEEASVDRHHLTGQPLVAFRLSSEGGTKFYAFTSSNVHENLAIVMDDRVRSVATINEPISERGQISGFGLEEAENIALILRTAALPVELEVVSQQSIGASLGEDTIRQGLYALLGGIVAVLLFMLVYYRTAGINAVVAQVLNFYIMFSVLSALNFTLTLPAIAGFILTIGMATDASVIIFERMKEEMRLGKTRKAVIEAGFSKAFWAIMDSNITTFIAALFLSQLGSGPIRGFAVSLSIGVFSSVFTALFVSRLIFDFSTDVFRSKNLSVSWKIRIKDSKQGLQPVRVRGGSL
ncbi:MAG: protein translocase subunit SecD [Treponema sp.]|jgi:preprotein translocase subunit SecD|nr:protein translocase subunit SecD [Treponema sp.]